MHRFLKNVILITLSLSFLGFTGKEKFVELNGRMNARGTEFFTQKSNNILYKLGTGTKAEIIKRKLFNSGNYGLKVRIASGPHKNEVTWVYYNVSNPTMALYESCPKSWSQSGVAACKGTTTSPERANASVTTLPTAATAEAPEEIKTLPTVTVRAERIPIAKPSVEAPCEACSVERNKPTAPTRSFVDDLVSRTTKNPLVGAYRVMADIYQSCHVLSLPPITHADIVKSNRYVHGSGKNPTVSAQEVDDFAASHYYLGSNPEPVNPSCEDMTKTAPLYLYGGKPKFTKTGDLDIFTRRASNGSRTVGIDCSAFVSSAFSISGLKLRPSIKNASQNITNSTGLRDFTEKNSCFNRPTFNKDKTITPGDVVAWKGHTYMIDKVGADPFGIAKAKNKGKFPQSISACSSFQPPLADLDFTIIQSTGYGAMSAMKIEAKNYKSLSTRSYMNLAVQACKAQFQTANSDFNAEPSRNAPVTLLRHKGDSDPQCSFAADKIPKLVGEQCTQGCFKEKI